MLVAGAVFLPLLSFIALQTGYSFQEQRRQMEMDALEAAARVNARVDAEILGDKSALNVLAGSSALSRSEWDRFRTFAVSVAAQRPSWNNVILTDAATGREILDIKSEEMLDRPARLEIRDTGQGMKNEVLERATEPFLTTKTDGNGTGLGLAQVQALMTQCDGTVEIESRPGKR